MKKGKILKQNSTHKAVAEDGKINIYAKGFKCGRIHYNDELLYSLAADREDDLFAIFERLDEDNRINANEFISSKELFDINPK